MLSLLGETHQHLEFKYIIVGGGSAGCLLARLLSMQQSELVAVIEAGPVTSHPLIIAPAYYPRIFGSGLDWSYLTEPQSELAGRQVAWPRGRMLGGSGAMNALIYMQPAPGDFERWRVEGRVDWDCTRDTQHIRNSPGIVSRQDSGCPWSDLPLSRTAVPHPWSEAFLAAAESLGLQKAEHWIQSSSNTCGLYQLTQSHGRRQHTGSQLSDSPLPNLRIVTGVTASKFNFQGEHIKSIELVDRQGNPRSLAVSGQVILAAGAIGSPTLLLRSGIGPADDLQAVGQKCKHSLPGVGKNLQDHLVFPLIFQTHDETGLERRFSKPVRDQYRTTGTGPLASNIAEAGAMFSLSDSPFPEFQIHFTPTHYLKYPITPSRANAFSLGVTDLHPTSRGELRLRSADSSRPPIIDPNYLQSTRDRQRLLAAMHWCLELSQAGELRSLISRELLPGEKRWDQRRLLRTIATFGQSLYHPVGTCRAGCDESAVVDAGFRVRGIRNLFIADASVLPDLPSGNTNAATLFIAQRLATRLLSAA